MPQGFPNARNRRSQRRDRRGFSPRSLSKYLKAQGSETCSRSMHLTREPELRASEYYQGDTSVKIQLSEKVPILCGPETSLCVQRISRAGRESAERQPAWGGDSKVWLETRTFCWRPGRRSTGIAARGVGFGSESARASDNRSGATEGSASVRSKSLLVPPGGRRSDFRRGRHVPGGLFIPPETRRPCRSARHELNSPNDSSPQAGFGSDVGRSGSGVC